MIKSLTIVTEDGRTRNWDLDFSDQGTLQMSSFLFVVRLPWVRLDFWKCPACTLDKSRHPTCPVAMVLAQYARDLADRTSFEKVQVHVMETDGRRLTLEEVALQNVVGELVRLAVFQSQCPVGRRVKPAMTRLRPFPDNMEILQALALFFALQSREQDGRLAPEQLRFMHSLHEVFAFLSKRLEHAGIGDVYLNAVVVLDSLSLLFSLSAPELIEKAVAECRTW